jgi:hypothetical protein
VSAEKALVERSLLKKMRLHSKGEKQEKEVSAKAA